MNAGQQPQPPPRPVAPHQPHGHTYAPTGPQATQQPPPPPTPPQALPVVQYAPPQAGALVLGAPPQPVAQQAAHQRAAHQLQYQQASQQAAMATTAEVLRPQALQVSAPAGAPPMHGGPAPNHGGPGPVREHRDWRVRRHRAIPRLRIGEHQAPDEALEQLQMAGSSFGFHLGRNQSGFPVTLTLFRPRPMAVSLAGGLWAARLLALRALRFGARVVVSTSRPEGWAALGRSVTGRSDRVIVLDVDMASDVEAHAEAPVLRLHDAPQPPAAEEPTPWCTRLTLLRVLGPDQLAVLPHADVVLAQRLSVNDAIVAASALRLSPNTVQQLQTLRDDMMATLTPTERNVFWVSPVAFERERLGNPSRN